MDQSVFSWNEGLNHGVSVVGVANEEDRKIGPKKLTQSMGETYTGRLGSVLDSDEREKLRIEYWAMLSGKRQKSIATLYAIGNNLLFHAAECFGAFEWQEHESGKRSIVGVIREKLSAMNEAFKKGQFVLCTALSHTKDFINRFWPEASQSRRAIAGWIDFFKELNLLDYVEQSFISGKWGNSRRYSFIDVEKLLVFLEAAEEHLGDLVYESYQDGKDDYTVNARGTAVRALFNGLFTGWGFRRTGDPDEVEPETWEETDLSRAGSRWSSLSEDGHWASDDKGVIRETYREMRDRTIKAFNTAVDSWRLVRGELGDCKEVKELKAAWQRMYDLDPWLLGG